jgi:rSAM/selenodomain-associated transferase 2
VSNPAPERLISVIVPTRNEAATLPRLLRSLADQRERHEIIVVDCDSPDGTAAMARAAGARVVRAPQGRGRQLAAGAASARGDVLLFLHADTIFPADGLAALRTSLDRAPASPGGNFCLVFAGDDKFSRLLTRFYAFIRRLGLFYGDSGIFVRRDAYDGAGGFQPLAIMEDHDFVRRLRRRGALVHVAKPALVTSSRRFADRRPAEIVARWLLLHAMYALGFDGETMRRIYDARSGRTPRSAQRRSLSDQS